MAVSKKEIRLRFEKIEKQSRFNKQVQAGNWEATTEVVKEGRTESLF
jgi:hypothetical protein